MENEDWKSLAAQLRKECLEPIKQTLIGKDEIIEVLGVALVAGENVFLLGPPGTAKSALVQELAARLSGRSFDYLLTRFTEPSELFGPFDLRRLRDGDLVTNTEGMLPEADFVFLDEIMNANSAVLNSLLLTLNERIFRRGRETQPLPMLLAIGASNRLPEDDALAALYDRFLFRVTCENVEEQQLAEVLRAGWKREHSDTSQTQIQIEGIRKLQQALRDVSLAQTQTAYLDLISRLRDAGLAISDRRAVKLQRAIAASAIVCGRQVAQVSDLWVLRYIWETPAQAEMLAAQVELVVNEYSEEAQESDRHPLADVPHGPDPEKLAEAIRALETDSKAESVHRSAILDNLTLLSARIEWVQVAESREHLRTQVAELRASIEENAA